MKLLQKIATGIVIIQIGFHLQILDAQLPTKDIITLSPDAAQLGAYGTVPVGLFTGTAQENIPIYVLKTKNLSLPVSLNYSSNGLIVDKVASWVGYDWSLEAGGLISLSVKGYKDKTIRERMALPAGFGSNAASMLTFLQTYYVLYDFQPDVYSYNFFGYTGKFIFETDGSTVITIPYKKMNINRTSPLGNSSFGDNFVITTSDGVKYVFAEKEDFYCYYCASQDNYPVTWYLTSVIHPAGDKIDFYYSTNSASFYTGISQQVIKLLYVSSCDENPICSEPENIAKALGTTNQIVHLDSIKSTEGGTIIFQKAGNRLDYTDGKRLDKIIIKNNWNEEIRSIEFKYSFISGSANYPKGYPLNYSGIQGPNYESELNYRMFLDTVKFIDSKHSKVYDYSFQYLNLDNLPSRLSFSQDHWGFFNGAYNNDFVPIDTVFPQFKGIGGNREPDGSYSRNGLLQRINYPGGGYSIIEYESNNSGGIKIGGCRVKKISSYNGSNSAPLIKKFFYNNKAVFTSSYGYYNRPYRADYFFEYNSYLRCSEYQYQTCRYGALVSNSQTSIYYNNNNSIVYPAVTISHGEDFEAGGEEHTFYVENDFHADLINTSYGGGNPFPAEYSNDGWFSGTRESETYFRKNSSGQFINVKSTRYSYNFDDIRNSKTYRCLAVTKRQSPDPASIGYDFLQDYDVAIYNLYSRWEQPVNTTVTEYDDLGNEFETTTSYSFDNFNHSQLTSETIINSKGESIQKKYYYPQDYTTLSENLPALIDKFMIAKIIDARTYNSNNSRLTSLEQYRYNVYGQTTDYFNADIGNSATNFSFDSGSPYKATHKGTYTYDSNLNLITTTPDNNISTSYIWGYKNAYPVIKGENISQNTLLAAVNNSLPSGFGTLEALLSDVNGIRDMTSTTQKNLWATFCDNLKNQSSLINAMVIANTFKPQVGMTSQTDPNGITTYYEYDSFGRLKMIKDHNGNILKTYEYHYGQ